MACRGVFCVCTYGREVVCVAGGEGLGKVLHFIFSLFIK